MNAPMQDLLFYYLLGAGILCAVILTVAVLVIMLRQKNGERVSVSNASEAPMRGDAKENGKKEKRKPVALQTLDMEEKGSLLLSAVLWGVAIPAAFFGIFHLTDRAAKASKPTKKKKKGCRGNCKCCRSKCPFGKLGCKGRFAKL